MENMRFKIINTLKRDKLPVIIYGTGKFAISIAEYLTDHNVSIWCFGESAEYYRPDKKTVQVRGKDYEIISNEKIINLNKKCNILLGMIDYRKINELNSIVPLGTKVFYLDVYPSHIIDETFIQNNYNRMKSVHDMLEDEKSRKVMSCFYGARLTGDVRELCEYYDEKEYSYDWKLLGLTGQDIVIDAGAYVGDTIDEMQKFCGGNLKRVFAFEPDDKNYKELLTNVEKKQYVRCVKAGLWNKSGSLKFDNSGTLAAKISDEGGGGDVRVLSVDDLVKTDEKYSHVTIIKMDVEGSELNALRGCEHYITDQMPKLAICVYHKNEDLLDIVEYLLALMVKSKRKYRFYLRQHSSSVEETVLYALPS